MSVSLKAAAQFETVITEKLQKELELGQMAGPFDFPDTTTWGFLYLVWSPKSKRANFDFYTTFPSL